MTGPLVEERFFSGFPKEMKIRVQADYGWESGAGHAGHALEVGLAQPQLEKGSSLNPLSYMGIFLRPTILYRAWYLYLTVNFKNSNL